MITYVQFQFKKCFSLGSIVHELWEEQFIHFPIGHRAKLCLKVVAISDRYKKHSIGKRATQGSFTSFKYETIK